MAYAPTESGDPNQYKSPDSTLDGTAKKPRGCMFYGCIVLIVLSVLGLLATGATVYTAYYYYNKLVQEYTATTPMTLPPLAITDEDRKSIDDRWKTFHEAADRGEAAELEITANDINALISENPDLKGTVFVSIEGSEVGGKISFPLSKTGLPGLSGRFFNGNATFTVTLEDGYLEAHLKSVEVNGKTPPADLMTQLSNENLLKDAKFDDKTREKMRKIESLTVKDGKNTYGATFTGYQGTPNPQKIVWEPFYYLWFPNKIAWTKNGKATARVHGIVIEQPQRLLDPLPPINSRLVRIAVAGGSDP